MFRRAAIRDPNEVRPEPSRRLMPKPLFRQRQTGGPPYVMERTGAGKGLGRDLVGLSGLGCKFVRSDDGPLVQTADQTSAMVQACLGYCSVIQLSYRTPTRRGASRNAIPPT